MGIWFAAYLALGLLSGFFAGLLGIGGGAIMVPILTTLFIAQGMPSEHLIHMALATSLSAIVMTSVSSIKAHHAHGAVNWPIVKKMSPAVMLGTFCAASLAQYVSAKMLAMIFVVFMTLVAIQMLTGKKPKPSRQIPGVFVLSMVSVLIGALSALVAIGGGSMTVPFLSWCNLNIKKAIASSAAIGLPIAVSGTLAYILSSWQLEDLPKNSLGYVYLPAMLLISLAAYFTAPIGAKLAHRLPVQSLKKVFAILIIVLAIRMFVSQW